MPESQPQHPISRRGFLITSACAASLALYSGEIERHWIEITHNDVTIPGLSPAFDGLRVAQLSDIHFDEYTEPFYLRRAVQQINELDPDMVVLTGDFVTWSPISKRIFKDAAWQCASILSELKCSERYAVLGNHDELAGPKKVIAALKAHGIQMLNNSYQPIERAGGRFWLAGVDDPVEGHPDPNAAIPESIRNIPKEPVVLLCHAPDYADKLLTRPEGQSIALMLSGHTHGGQIVLPFLGPVHLPDLGKKYVSGRFRFGNLQLYVSRGLGTVILPFRLHCPPEITMLTLRADPPGVHAG